MKFGYIEMKIDFEINDSADSCANSPQAISFV